jgi:carboxymethylenebutenolidase
LKMHSAVNPEKLAATGYCAGGTVTWRLATLSPDLRAAAPFYGTNPPDEAVPNIRAAVLGVYGELDERVNAGIPDIDAMLQAAGKTYELKVYPSSLHGFHDDSGNPAYNPATAPEAWRDTLSWFARYLELPAPRL